MYKINTGKTGIPIFRAQKIVRIMRLITIMIVALIMQVSASGFAQRITFSSSGASLKELFAEIKKQTGYNVVWSEESLISSFPQPLEFKALPLEQVLNTALAPQSLTYTIEKRTIIIRKKSNSIIEKIVNYFSLIDLRGEVLNEFGQPLPGATIKVVGSKRGALTDSNGIFQLTNIDPNAIIIISFIGYEDLSIKANTSQRSFSMVKLDAKLEEINVISTGYQKIKKDQLTGAATTVTTEQYQQRVALTGNFLESLEGKVPGLVYNGQSGELSIRGVSTFDAVKQPLIVLDGFPTEIDLRTINPNDIVSISVLRDAAAASIYGVRASNGVIVVETRRGKSGKPSFNFTSSYGLQDSPDFNYLKYIPAAELVQLQRDNFNIAKPSSLFFDLEIYKMNPAEEILFKGPRAGVANPELTQAQVDQQLAALGSYDNLNDYQRLFYQKRQVKNINLDVSGGNELSTYFIGFNYIGERPVARRSDNNQFNLNVANTIKISKRINFDFRGSYTNITNKNGNIPSYGAFYPYERLTGTEDNALPVTLGPGRDFIASSILKTNNDRNQAAGLYDGFYYPYRDLTANTTTIKTSSIKFQGRLNGKITDWLNLDVGGNYENQNVATDVLQTEESFQARSLINAMALRDAATGRGLFTNLPKGNILRKNNQRINNYTIRGQLNFNKDFQGSEHNLSGLVGVEQRKTTNAGYLTSFFGYDGQSLILKPINMGILNTSTSPAFPVYRVFFNSNNYFNETFADRRFNSYYGQATYIYRSKYVLTGSFRVDQSNLFGSDPKYRNKPLWSTGLNWRLGDEEFIRKLTWIDQLQLRAATGFNGNVPSSSNGSFLILESRLNTNLNSPLAYNDVLAPQNQSLRWETTQNYNIGLDYGLFKNRVSGAVDYYIKRSKDVFGQFDSDPTSGFNQYNANTASIENRGLEILVNTVNIRSRKFEWHTQLTASFNNNKVLKVKATEFANSTLIANASNYVQGQPLGSLYSYNYGGLNSQGQPFVTDRNGNQRIITLFTAPVIDVTRDDLIYNGTITPKHVVGFNNQFKLGEFDLSFLLMYYGGHVMRVEQPNPNNISGSIVTLQGSNNFWRSQGDESNTRIPGYAPASASTVGYYQQSALAAYQYASEFVRKADFIRLRDVVLTYHANAKFLNKAGLYNTQVRLQAQNPLRYTFSGNDIDPDAINRLTGVRSLETQPFYSLTLLTNF